MVGENIFKPESDVSVTHIYFTRKRNKDNHMIDKTYLCTICPEMYAHEVLRFLLPIFQIIDYRGLIINFKKRDFVLDDVMSSGISITYDKMESQGMDNRSYAGKTAPEMDLAHRFNDVYPRFVNKISDVCYIVDAIYPEARWNKLPDPDELYALYKTAITDYYTGDDEIINEISDALLYYQKTYQKYSKHLPTIRKPRGAEILTKEIQDSIAYLHSEKMS